MTNNIMIESTVVCCYSTHGHRKDVYYTICKCLDILY